MTIGNFTPPVFPAKIEVVVAALGIALGNAGEAVQPKINATARAPWIASIVVDRNRARASLIHHSEIFEEAPTNQCLMLLAAGSQANACKYSVSERQ